MNEPLHERMRMTIAPNSPWRLTRGIVANWSEEVSILLSELAQAKADVGALRVELLLILDHVDYTNGACAVNEMVGAVLPHQIIARARERLTALPEHLRGANEPTD